MTDWIEQYSAALDIRDAREKAHKPYIDAYTRLADRTATTTTSSPSPLPPTTTTTPTSNTDLLAAQRARTTLTNQLQTLTLDHTTLEKQHQTTTAQLTTLTRQKAETERRLRDREEELSKKKKFNDNAQDELVALQIQLNMAEQRSVKLERENKELVDRWMAKMGEEAERVNRDSRWQ